jgi:hypothetical protein
MPFYKVLLQRTTIITEEADFEIEARSEDTAEELARLIHPSEILWEKTQEERDPIIYTVLLRKPL